MIIFAMPLRAEESANNWNVVLAHFHRTIRSIFNQTNPNFRCIVACNKKPVMDREYDERLEFIELPYMPVPNTWLEMARDRLWKLLAVAVRARAILEDQDNPENGIYIMPVDADDLLSRHIAEYCERHPNEHGLVSRDGYVWQSDKRYFRTYKDMHTYCGSCGIIKEQQLPWISVCDFAGERSPLLRTYNVRKLPSNFLIDREGNIIARDIYSNALAERVAQLLND